MKTHQVECSFNTGSVPDFVDITQRVQELLDESRNGAGQVTLFSPSAGCSLVANERESGLLKDIETTLARLGGPESNGRHPIGSNSLVLPAVAGRLRLGTWQATWFCEWDGPRTRTLQVQLHGR